MRQIGGCDPFAAVRYGHAHLVLIGRGAHLDPSAGGGVPEGIADQVRKHAADLPAVHQHRIHIGSHAALQRHAIQGGERREAFEGVRDQVGDGVGLPFELQAPRVQLRQLE